MRIWLPGEDLLQCSSSSIVRHFHWAYQGVAISLKNWSWNFEQIWAESWPFGGEMRRQIRMKTIRNLNLDHLGGKCQILTIWGEMREMRRSIPPRWSRFSISPPDGQDSGSWWFSSWFVTSFPPRMVKIQIPDGFDLDSLPDFPPNGQDSAEICSKCQLQFLRLMATPWVSLYNSGGGWSCMCPRTTSSKTMLPAIMLMEFNIFQFI